MAERHKHDLAWNDETQEWFQYGQTSPGVWTQASEVDIWNVIRTELDAKDVPYSSAYLTDVTRLMRCDLIVKDWDPPTHLLPLQNGVLNLQTKKLQDHSPDHHFLWSLPYAYNPLATCELIQEWMLEAMGGKADRVQVLRAFLYAVLMGRIDLQRYLECIGPGGTGKSTYIRLCESLVGKENNFPTELKHLESNRFETSGIYGKRLVTITDSERYGGNVTALKALTGNDTVRAEIKYKPQKNGFRPNCMVVVAANEVIQSADYTSGLQRRRLSVPFEVKPKVRRDLEKEFQPLIPGLLNWVLAMDPEEVEYYLVHTEEAAPSLAQARRETLCDINPLADWLNTCVVHTPGIRTQVGVAQRSKDKEDPRHYLDTDKYLYANYAEYCEGTGTHRVSQRRFSTLLRDLCQSQLNWSDVFRIRLNGRSFFEGLSLRQESESPAPITDAPPPVTDPPPAPGGGASGDQVGVACGSKPADSGDYRASGGDPENFSVPHTDPSSGSDQHSSGESCEITPTTPTYLHYTRVSAIPDPHLTPTSSPPQSRGRYPPVIRVGDLCRYWGPQGAMNVTCGSKELEVLQVEGDLATVTTRGWVHPHEIPIRHLRKLRR